jgi:hypothetical protein
MFGRKSRQQDEALRNVAVPDLDSEVTAHWNRGAAPSNAPPPETASSASLDFGPTSYRAGKTKEYARKRRRLIISVLVGLLVSPVAVGAVSYLIRYINPVRRAMEPFGERIGFGQEEQEEIYYTPDISSEQARQLGVFLQQEGMFNDDGAKSVRLSKNGEVFVVGFVLAWNSWESPQTLMAFRELLPRLSRRVFNGVPVEIHLCAQQQDSHGRLMPAMRVLRAEDHP